MATMTMSGSCGSAGSSAAVSQSPTKRSRYLRKATWSTSSTERLAQTSTASAGAATATRRARARRRMSRVMSRPAPRAHGLGGRRQGGAVADHGEGGPIEGMRGCRVMDERELRLAQRAGKAHALRLGEILEKPGHQLHGRDRWHLPMAREECARAGIEEGFGEPRQRLAAARPGVAGRQHDEIRVELERGDLARIEEPVFGRVARLLARRRQHQPGLGLAMKL